MPNDPCAAHMAGLDTVPGSVANERHKSSKNICQNEKCSGLRSAHVWHMIQLIVLCRLEAGDYSPNRSERLGSLMLGKANRGLGCLS